jgi:hypothetical protein
MAYLSRARLEGSGESAAAIEAMFNRAARVLGEELNGAALEDEQVIETQKGEPEGEHRYHGRRIVYFDLSKQVVRAPVPDTPIFHA